MIDRFKARRSAAATAVTDAAGLPGRVEPNDRVGHAPCAHSKEERRCDGSGRAGP